ncbi:MAG: bifunctional helix-turn-helix transcriptional regulator/GNAT family N-acetyltransferase, partial [Gammaproteobacteria bacterium]|nr:bifunctional helix-turn-helix transcriptional regulator/GNAT family N-acetyltransferase [Gammaproteobacteria bacterium]
FQAAWFPIIFLLSRRGSLGVMEIAEVMRQSHSAVSQISKKLQEKGYIERACGDGSGGAKQCLQLTPAGEALVQKLKPLWRDLQSTVQRYIARTDFDLLNAMRRFEAELRQRDLVEDVLTASRTRRVEEVEIIDYLPQYAEDFRRLNIEWLEKYFYVEPIDEEILSQPQEKILALGGAIFFARAGDSIVGTCALLNKGEGIFELTKMGVNEAYQGLGLGRRLAEAVIERYRQSKGVTLYLESNSKLKPAVRLYESLGFQHQPYPDGGSPYRRSNVYMVYREGD